MVLKAFLGFNGALVTGGFIWRIRMSEEAAALNIQSMTPLAIPPFCIIGLPIYFGWTLAAILKGSKY